MERKSHSIERHKKGIRKYERKITKIEYIKEEYSSSDNEKRYTKHSKSRSRSRTKSEKIYKDYN